MHWQLECFDEKYKVPVIIKVARKEYTKAARGEIAILHELNGLRGTQKLLRAFDHRGFICMSFDIPGETLRTVLNSRSPPTPTPLLRTCRPFARAKRPLLARLPPRAARRRRQEGTFACVFPPDAFRDIALQLTEALRYVHSKGIVHTDVRPDTVLLAAARDGRPIVTLIDFGAAVHFKVIRLTTPLPPFLRGAGPSRCQWGPDRSSAECSAALYPACGNQARGIESRARPLLPGCHV
jgi:serine/threonine protein kinase